MIVLLLIFCLVESGCDMRSTIEQATRRNVLVETTKRYGSGVIISTGYVLTAFHLIREGDKLTADGKMAEVVAIDLEHDLMLLKAETRAVFPIQISDDVEQGEPVLYVANTNGHKNFLSVGMVNFIDKEAIYTDTTAVAGCSGGGLYNTQGKLIGINDAHEYNAIAVHVHAKHIKAFLDQYQEWRK